MNCWTLPIICTNAVVASVGSLTPLPRPFTVFHVTAPHFLWGALLPHSLPGNSVFPPFSSCSDRQGAQGGQSRALGVNPHCVVAILVCGEWGRKELDEGDRAAGKPVPGEPWTLKPTPYLTSHLHEITNTLFFVLSVWVGLPQLYQRSPLFYHFTVYSIFWQF